MIIPHVNMYFSLLTFDYADAPLDQPLHRLVRLLRLVAAVLAAFIIVLFLTYDEIIVFIHID